MDHTGLHGEPPPPPFSTKQPPIHLTGAGLPGTSRFVACGKSPLTGIWGESACGGNFGAELKKVGWDGIIFKGASDNPCYLLIEDSRCKLIDASDF